MLKRRPLEGTYRYVWAPHFVGPIGRNAVWRPHRDCIRKASELLIVEFSSKKKLIFRTHMFGVGLFLKERPSGHSIGHAV